MTVKVTKPAINVREELADLRKPTGIAGEAMLRAETPQEQFNLIGAGHRNMLINGAMQHWQRGTGATAVGSSGDYLPDRFKFWESTDGAYTFERSTDTPSGFQYSTKLQVTSADTSLSTGQYAIFAQHLEVQDCLSARMGYSDAQELTLSFWVKSSKTGTYSMTLHKEEGTDYFCHRTFNINAANTWEHKSFTYPPNTLSGISANSTGTGFRVVCWLAGGSAYKSANTEGQWSTNANRYASDQNVNWMDSTSNDFYITGVQLELGKVATPFEHRSYGEELALCQRYFYKRNLGGIGIGNAYQANAWTYQHFVHPVTMRATPTTTYTGATAGTWPTAVINGVGSDEHKLTVYHKSQGAVSDVYIGSNTPLIVSDDAEL